MNGLEKPHLGYLNESLISIFLHLWKENKEKRRYVCSHTGNQYCREKVENKMKIKRQVHLVQVNSETWYVSRPTSWMAGLARSKWIERYYSIQARIASPSLWSDLQDQYPQFLLIEYENGQVELKETISSH